MRPGRRTAAPGRHAARPDIVHVLLAATAVLAGCAIRPVPATRFYRLLAPPLEPATAGEAPRRLPGVLVVERFAADDLVAERPILYSNGTGLELRQHRYHHWAEPPTDMLQQHLLGYLRAAGAAAMVTGPEARVRPDFVLRGRLSRFERIVDRDHGGAVRVCIETHVSLTRMTDRRLLWSDLHRVEVPVRDAAIVTSVAAFDRGLAEVLARVAAGIATVE
jgi:ABC-type uncharacterized transport system auxiliary subunit